MIITDYLADRYFSTILTLEKTISKDVVNIEKIVVL